MKYRIEEIADAYTKDGLFKPEIVAYGNQILYEMEKDLSAMKWALERICDFLKVANERNLFTGTLHIAKDELLKRISKYSCPANLKDKYKTKERCPLGDGCKCLENAEILNVQPPNDMQCGVGKNNI